MPWDEDNYPVSLKNLTAPVRRKAIDMANALIAEGSDEGRAIAIATFRAEVWARRRGKQIKKIRPTTPASTHRKTIQRTG